MGLAWKTYSIPTDWTVGNQLLRHVLGIVSPAFSPPPRRTAKTDSILDSTNSVPHCSPPLDLRLDLRGSRRLRFVPLFRVSLDASATIADLRFVYVLLPTGWLYSDFFLLDNYPAQLAYTGIYRFLNNPERSMGGAAFFGLSIISGSRLVFALAIFSALSHWWFLSAVERYVDFASIRLLALSCLSPFEDAS